MQFRIKTQTILLMVISAILGFGVNYWSTRIANNQLKNDLLAELTALNQAQNMGRLSEEQNMKIEQRKKEIEAQLKIINA